MEHCRAGGEMERERGRESRDGERWRAARGGVRERRRGAGSEVRHRRQGANVWPFRSTMVSRGKCSLAPGWADAMMKQLCHKALPARPIHTWLWECPLRVKGAK